MVVLPNRIRYYQLCVGSGDISERCPGDLVVIDLQGRVAGVACAQNQPPTGHTSPAGGRQRGSREDERWKKMVVPLVIEMNGEQSC